MRRSSLLFLAVLVVLPSQTTAGARRASRFETATVQSFTGSVTAIDRITLHKGGATGVRLTLRVGPETLPVQLGPARYVDAQPVRLAVGDVVTVRGSRVTNNERPAIVAISVTKGDATLSLRDDSGAPLWRAARAEN